MREYLAPKTVIAMIAIIVMVKEDQKKGKVDRPARNNPFLPEQRSPAVILNRIY